MCDVVSGMYSTGSLPHATELVHSWQQRQEAIGSPTAMPLPTAVKRPTGCKAFHCIIRRDVVERARSENFVLHNIIFAVAAFVNGMVVGDISQDQEQTDRLLYCFFNLLVGVAFIETFSRNKLILWREVSSGYSCTTYFLSQNTIDIPLLFCYSVTYAIIYVSLCTPLCSHILFWTTLILMGFASSGLAYLFAVYLTDPLLPFVAITLVLNVVLTGFFLDIKLGDPLPFFLSPGRWGCEMIAVSSYNKWPPVKFPDQVIEKAGWDGYDPGNEYWDRWWCLALLGFSTRGVAYAGLFLCNRGPMGMTPIRNILMNALGRCVPSCFLDKSNDDDIQESTDAQESIGPNEGELWKVAELPHDNGESKTVPDNSSNAGVFDVGSA